MVWAIEVNPIPQITNLPISFRIPSILCYRCHSSVKRKLESTPKMMNLSEPTYLELALVLKLSLRLINIDPNSFFSDSSKQDHGLKKYRSVSSST